MNKEQQQLALDNIKLVGYTIKRFKKILPAIETEELYAEGYLGLCEAAINFKPEKGYKFSTYAVSWILGKLLRIKKYYGKSKGRYNMLKNYGLEVVNSSGERFSLLDQINDSCSIDEETALKVDLERSINKLSESQKYAILCFMAGYKQKKIAGLLKVSQTTVSTILKHAKESIKQDIYL